MQDDGAHEILIVDDNQENLKVLSMVLKEQGYSVRAATTGEQALQSLEASEPALVLLDVHLPGVDGLDVCKQIRNMPKFDQMPVIFLSALGDTFNKLLGFEAGGNDYVTKPFDAAEVKVRIKSHLRGRARDIELMQVRER